jgi:hypothetical protein
MCIKRALGHVWRAIRRIGKGEKGKERGKIGSAAEE